MHVPYAFHLALLIVFLKPLMFDLWCIFISCFARARRH